MVDESTTENDDGRRSVKLTDDLDLNRDAFAAILGVDTPSGGFETGLHFSDDARDIVTILRLGMRQAPPRNEETAHKVQALIESLEHADARAQDREEHIDGPCPECDERHLLMNPQTREFRCRECGHDFSETKNGVEQ